MKYEKMRQKIDLGHFLCPWSNINSKGNIGDLLTLGNDKQCRKRYKKCYKILYDGVSEINKAKMRMRMGNMKREGESR